MPGLNLVGRDAEKKGSLVSLELALLLVLAIAAGFLLWTAITVASDDAETGASGYEAGLDDLKSGF